MAAELDELHQKKPETATFSHDRDECLHWEQGENVHRDKKQLHAAFVDSFAGRKKNFEENRTGPRASQNNFKNMNQNWNELTVPV